MRPAPKDKDGQPVAVPEIEVKERPGYVTQEREYELITPLFGGGVEPGVADPVTTIRATEIRGHLRFWWRATRGGQFDGDLGKMKKAEDKLWGAASAGDSAFPSQVSVQVIPTNRGRKFIAKNNRGEEVDVFALNSLYGYVAFPLRDRRQHVIEGVKFKLNIRYPSASRTDIEAALWAWETFGGIGGRTRRGFGAIKLLSIAGRLQPLPNANANQVHQLITQNFATHLAAGELPPDLPCISKDSRDLVVTETRGDAIDAWKYLIKGLKEFRQKRNQGNQPNRPGRSQWPEPDAIRRITGRASARHNRPLSRLDVFPRAEFGLPMVFKFKDDGQGDPDVTMLEGADDRAKRLASPLILRPLACANNQAVGLVVILDTPRTPPSGLALNGAPGNPPVTSDLTELSDDELNSIAPLNGSEDVLAAFLDTL